MNRIFYAMVLVAFAVATYFQLTDPTVKLSEDDEKALIAAVDASGPGAWRSWLEEANAETDGVVEAMAGSARLSEADLVKKIDVTVSQLEEPSGKAVAKAIATAGRFNYGEQSAMERFTAGLFDMAKASVMSVVLPLIGAMTFFLGLMKVAEDAGAMKIIAKLLRPIMVLLFPDVPGNHPAMSAMILNMAANALGLGNAATPFGIKAMQELDKLNPVKGTATNAMCLFLAINTSSITILPTGTIAIRAALGSKDPAGILGPTLMATILSTTAAIIATKIYQRFTPVTEAPGAQEIEDAEAPTEDDDAYPLFVSVLAICALAVFAGVAVVYGGVVGVWIVPLLVVGFLTFGVVNGVAVYESFVEGAKEGWQVGVRIVPYLVAILATVGMLRGSGAIALFVDTLGPFTGPLGMPPEALPMALLRPLSGSGAFGVMMATLNDYGADSHIGYLVSTLQGSTETTFYVIAVYFGAVQVTRIRHAMAAALTADAVGIIGAVIAVSMYVTFVLS